MLKLHSSSSPTELRSMYGKTRHEGLGSEVSRARFKLCAAAR